MAKIQDSSTLDDARRRLDQALSRLSEEATASRDALAQSRDAQEKTIQEMSNQADRMLTLEQENHRLHEQVAALSLQQSTGDDDQELATLKAEKNALQQNYDLLKRQYTSLQDEFEGLQDRISSQNGAGSDITATLEKQVAGLLRERDDLRAELDQVIEQLESYLAETKRAAGAH